MAQIAQKFRSEIWISRVEGTQEVDGKSILGLLLLAASQGTHITIAVYGEDEAAAFAAVEDLIARSFDEDQ